MPTALACERCGAELPPEAADGPVRCSYCGTTSVPAPRVVEKIVERVVVVSGGADARTRGETPADDERAACPRCGFPLIEKLVGTHTVRGCDTCGGVFLEPQTVAVLERGRDEEILYTIARFLRILMPYPMDRRQELACPFCKTRFARRDLGETGHSIDTCATHGTFFDRGELSAFMDFSKDQRAGEISEDDLEAAGVGVKKGFLWWKR